MGIPDPQQSSKRALEHYTESPYGIPGLDRSLINQSTNPFMTTSRNSLPVDVSKIKKIKNTHVVVELHSQKADMMGGISSIEKSTL